MILQIYLKIIKIPTFLPIALFYDKIKTMSTLNQNLLLATDTVILTVVEDKLKVMLIKRSKKPFYNTWTLPGSLLLENESIDDCAKRTLTEKTNIKENFYLEQLKTFGETSRYADPEMNHKRVVSVSYLAILDYQQGKSLLNSLKDQEQIKLFDVKNLPKIGFDHQKIIEQAIQRIQNKIRYTKIAFSLVPEEFTIPKLRECCELILEEKIDATNFRTKLKKLNILNLTTKKQLSGSRGQPAPLFTVNHKSLKELKNTESLFN